MDDAAKSQISRAFLTALLVAGTLDILSAFLFSGLNGVTPGQVLRYVASGPFGDGMRDWGLTGAAIGLAVHFFLMNLMVDVLGLSAMRWPALLTRWVLTGIVYGLIIYGVMYWIVTPLRFGRFPTLSLWGVGNALFSHIVCVGLPMAYVLKRMMPRRAD